jgi:hypothetical protein
MNTAENILTWRTLATPEDIDAGRNWYPFARRCAADMATKYGVPLDTAAGIIAVLSPQTEWLANLRAAETILRHHAAGQAMPTPAQIPDALYYRNVRKAWQIAKHTGTAPFPRCNGEREGSRGVRKCQPARDDCAAADYLHGPKVCEFHETILGKRAGRVVDVWATRAADINPYDMLTLTRDDPRCAGVPGTRFATLQAAYHTAAEHIGEDARDLQAIVWTTIRRTWRRPGSALQTEIPW